MLEDGEGQYPLEDLLDAYLLYISDFLASPPETWTPGSRVTLEFGGELDAVRKATELVGKRVHNRKFVSDGQQRVRLAIDDDGGLA